MYKPTFKILFLILLISNCKSESDPDIPTDLVENWYSVSSIDKQTWAIQEPRSSQGNVSYLITGSERAIVFDSGTGENKGQDGTKIRYKIQELTDLPVTLLLSHFHFDHNQNLSEFDHVAFPGLSFLKEEVDENDEYKFTRFDLFHGGFPTSIKVNEWLPINTDIDLGERNIQILNLPGHTRESIVIIDHESRQAFTGDFLYGGALFVFDKSDFRIYLKSVDRFMTIVDEGYSLYGAHGRPKVSYQYLLATRDLLNCILNSDCYSETISTVLGRNATIYSSQDGGANIYLVHTN